MANFRNRPIAVGGRVDLASRKLPLMSVGSRHTMVPIRETFSLIAREVAAPIDAIDPSEVPRQLEAADTWFENQGRVGWISSFTISAITSSSCPTQVCPPSLKPMNLAPAISFAVYCALA